MAGIQIEIRDDKDYHAFLFSLYESGEYLGAIFKEKHPRIKARNVYLG